MGLKEGDKVIINIGKLRGTSNKLGSWGIPNSMLLDGTVATVRECYSDYYKLNECLCDWSYPIEILIVYKDTKRQLLNKIKDFK